VLNSTMIYCNDQSYMKPSKKTSVPDKPKYIEIKHYILCDEVQKREVVLQYISTDELITNILVKPLSKMKKFAYSRNKMELVETTSLLKKEEIAPRLGGSTDVLLIYGQSFFQFKKWSRMSSAFPVRKWFEISNGHAFSSSENGPDRTIIFVMKMVR
jgi:hypothetical protein